jgi:hypothetical protein
MTEIRHPVTSGEAFPPPEPRPDPHGPAGLDSAYYDYLRRAGYFDAPRRPGGPRPGTICRVCGKRFSANRGARYCSHACRQRAYRARHPERTVALRRAWDARERLREEHQRALRGGPVAPLVERLYALLPVGGPPVTTTQLAGALGVDPDELERALRQLRDVCEAGAGYDARRRISTCWRRRD